MVMFGPKWLRRLTFIWRWKGYAFSFRVTSDLCHSSLVETITISRLKAEIRAVLARVRNGACVTVLDRKTPIAVLAGVRPASSLEIAHEAVGAFRPPVAVRTKCGAESVAALLADRRRR